MLVRDFKDSLMRNCNKESFTIGVLGGMGTYATIHLFQQYAELFVAEKEWDRPRIIIDNRCTMPSRVRAFLYGEKSEQLINEMSDSFEHLIGAGCNRIVLACNTSHLFLDQIYDKVPDLEKYVVHIIHLCVNKIVEDRLEEIYLLGSEGTIESRIYQDALANEGVKCLCPKETEYAKLRECIESVKQNNYTDNSKKAFLELVNRYDACILGCTELPILYERYKSEVKCKRIYDPLYLGLIKLKEEFDNE